MPDFSIDFGGEQLTIPGAYAQADINSKFSNPNQVVPPLIIIGYGYGGAPATPYRFANVNDWLAFVRGGTVGEFAPVLATPSNDSGINGVQGIIYFNACESTQSSTVLSALVSATSESITEITSTNYGLPSNQLQLSATPVVTASGVNLTLYDGYSGQSISQNNVGLPFTVEYTGSGNAVISVIPVASSFVPGSITITANGVLLATLQIGPSGYTSTSSLVAYLNGLPDFVATPVGDTTLPLVDLDIGTYTIASGSTAYITSAFNGPAYFINQYCSNFATATTVYAGSPTTGTLSFTSVSNKNFTGATSVPPTLSDYAACFTAALQVPGWAVIADSNSSEVIALGEAHAKLASTTIYGKWRRFFSGSSLGDSVSTISKQAQTMNSQSSSYFAPGIEVQNPTTGTTTLYGGYMVAAAAAAIACGNDVALPLTNKTLNAVAVEVQYDITDIAALQDAGVAVVGINQQNTPVIISDATTSQDPTNNPLDCFNQEVAAVYWTLYTIVNSTRKYVGTIASPADETAIANAIKVGLNGIVRTSNNQANAVLTSWDKTSLNIVYTGNNQLASVSVSVTVVGQNRFITNLVTVNLYNGTTTLTTTANSV